MNRSRLIAAFCLLVLRVAQDVSASAALDRVIPRQRTVPSYTEHLYGRVTVRTGVVDPFVQAIAKARAEAVGQESQATTQARPHGGQIASLAGPRVLSVGRPAFEFESGAP